MAPSLKLKIYDKEISPDQAILTTEGSLLALKGIAMMSKPAWVQDNALKAETSRSNPMTRIAGLGISAAGAHIIAAGCSEDRKVQRRAAKVAAGHSAVMAGLAAAQLGGKDTEKVMEQNKLVGVLAVTAINAGVMAWRGFKKGEVVLA
eukprot:jgi/Ulvmu1/6407/UM003_0036.1